MGKIVKEFTLFKPKFTIDCNGWQVCGDWLEWDYTVLEGNRTVMHAYKEVLNLTDTYVLEISNPKDSLICLMIMLAIDAVKCSKNR